MGMFDYVAFADGIQVPDVKVPMAETYRPVRSGEDSDFFGNYAVFQTKNFHCLMDTYIVEEDGIYERKTDGSKKFIGLPQIEFCCIAHEVGYPGFGNVISWNVWWTKNKIHLKRIA